MKGLNNYIFEVYDLIHKNYQSGFVEKPKDFKIPKRDKKIINKIYEIYSIYRYKIDKKSFYKMVIHYSLQSENCLIKSASDIAEMIEKTIRL